MRVTENEKTFHNACMRAIRTNPGGATERAPHLDIAKLCELSTLALDKAESNVSVCKTEIKRLMGVIDVAYVRTSEPFIEDVLRKGYDTGVAYSALVALSEGREG